MANELIGRWGERLAAEYLQKKHYRIVGANYRCRMGEIDLIAEKGRYIVFVEVKLRTSSAFEKQPRFDVIEIYAHDGMETARPSITHLEDAFS